MWSEAFTTLARSQTTVDPRVTIDAAAPHQRSVICGIGDGAQILSPDGTSVTLHVDPASDARRCAGFWATAGGWHQLRDGKRTLPMHIRDATQTTGLAAQSLREATRALVASGPANDDPVSDNRALPSPGPRWPWFIVWLLLATSGWWLERSRFGLPHTATPR